MVCWIDDVRSIQVLRIVIAVFRLEDFFTQGRRVALGIARGGCGPSGRAVFTIWLFLLVLIKAGITFFAPSTDGVAAFASCTDATERGTILHRASTRRTFPASRAVCGIGIPSQRAADARVAHANKLAGKAQAARRALVSGLASPGALCALDLVRLPRKPTSWTAAASFARAIADAKFARKAWQTRRPTDCVLIIPRSAV